MLLLLLACSAGTITSAQGSDPLETAVFLDVPDPDLDTRVLMLSNSLIDCEYPDGDGQELLTETENVTLALSREGSRMVFITLNRFQQDSWEGHFPIDSELTTASLDGLHPFLAEAWFYEVTEAALEEENGLLQSYKVTASRFTQPPLGSVQIERDDDELLVGSFGLDEEHVSGTFRAEPCKVPVDESIIPLLVFMAGTNTTAEE